MVFKTESKLMDWKASLMKSVEMLRLLSDEFHHFNRNELHGLRTLWNRFVWSFCNDRLPHSHLLHLLQSFCSRSVLLFSNLSETWHQQMLLDDLSSISERDLDPSTMLLFSSSLISSGVITDKCVHPTPNSIIHFRVCWFFPGAGLPDIGLLYI
jgi:hypothetical protein